MILGLACTTTQAQSILRRLERAARTTAERTAERKVEEKVEEGVSKALDEAFEEGEKKEQKDGQTDRKKTAITKKRQTVRFPGGPFKTMTWCTMTGTWKKRTEK
jgi:flagellar biosynthesis/type III secretory pathway protein FliH